LEGLDFISSEWCTRAYKYVTYRIADLLAGMTGGSGGISGGVGAGVGGRNYEINRHL